MNNDPPDTRKGQSGRIRAEDRRGLNQNAPFPTQEQLKDTPLHNPEKGWEEPQNGKLGRKILLTLAAVIFLCSLSLLAFILLNKDSSTHLKKQADLAPPKNFIEEASSAEIEEAIQACVSGFMNASSNEERSLFIIKGRETLPALDEYYSRPGIHPPSDFGKISQNEKAAFRGVTIRSVLALETDQSIGWVFNILPTQTGVKIDWESSIGYGEKSWEDFYKAKQSTPVIMRVFLARSPAESQIADPKEFGFCKVYIRGDDNSLPGLFSIKSPVALALKKIIPPGGRQPVRARLRWNPDGTAIEVIEILHNFWIDLAQYQQFFTQTDEQ